MDIYQDIGEDGEETIPRRQIRDRQEPISFYNDEDIPIFQGINDSNNGRL